MKRNICIFLAALFLLTGVPVLAESPYLTRGEVVEMLLEAADFYNPDVQKSDIIKGYEDGLLHEERSVTRAEALVMLSRAFEDLPTPTGHNARVALPKESFTDLPDWAVKELGYIFDAGLVAGTESGIFTPDANVTMGQMELFIDRVYALYGTNEKDDFYATVNKESLETLELIQGNPMAGTLYDMQFETLVTVVGLLYETIENSEKGTPGGRIAALYETILDTESRNAAGITPITSYLTAIDGADSLEDLAKLQVKISKELYANPFVGFSLETDYADSTRYIVEFQGYFPTLPKDVYLTEDMTQKAPYLAFLEALLVCSGETEEAAKEKVAAFWEYEKKLAADMLQPEEMQDVDKIYNLYSFDELCALFPMLDLEAQLAADGLTKEEKIMVTDPGLMHAVAESLTEENLQVLKTLMKLTVLYMWGPMLQEDFSVAVYDYQAALYGVENMYTPEEDAFRTVQAVMSEYLGRLYAEQFFGEAEKQEVKKMVEDILDIYARRIEDLPWMSAETKEKALKKLETMEIKIGYPDKWDASMENAEILGPEEGGTYFSNMMTLVDEARRVQSLAQGKPVDRKKWVLPTFSVNAAYVPDRNEIVLPAGILQAPLYDKDASYEENMGGIGYVIAHEITHAFDNDGAKFDKNGNAADWWTAEDFAKFEALCEDVVLFFDGAEGIPGVPTDGRLTLSENVADLGAAACITEAVQKKGGDLKVMYRAMANVWASTKTREVAMLYRTADMHSDDKLRINLVLMQLDAFHEAFDIKPGDGMYLAPEKRLKIW